MDGSNVRVETFVLEHFNEQGWKGFHSENSIITTLFALLFFDILFDDSIPGAFSHSYQTRPSDLYTEFFFESRRESILKRLDEIRQGLALDLIQKVCDREGERRPLCIGLSWNRFTAQDVCEIADCIGPSPLASICEAFATQYWSHRGGIPDLCLWKPDTKLFKLVEVKSATDRLSEKQNVWLAFLASVNVDAEVVHVTDSGGKRRKLTTL